MLFSTRRKEVPRTVVRTWLSAARLPLRAVQVVAHGSDQETEWPAVLAYESFEANVKQLTGSVLRDDELVQEGRTIQAKVGQLRTAAQLETIAERRKATVAQSSTRRERRWSGGADA